MLKALVKLQRTILFNIIFLSENDCPKKMGKKPDSPLCAGKCPDTVEENKFEFKLGES